MFLCSCIWVKLAPLSQVMEKRDQISRAHQRRRQCQAPHWGFQLIHRWRDTPGAVRHQRFDLDFELFLAVILVVFWVTGGEKLLSLGGWWTWVKDKVPFKAWNDYTSLRKQTHFISITHCRALNPYILHLFILTPLKLFDNFSLQIWMMV